MRLEICRPEGSQPGPEQGDVTVTLRRSAPEPILFLDQDDLDDRARSFLRVDVQLKNGRTARVRLALRELPSGEVQAILTAQRRGKGQSVQVATDGT